MRKELAFRIRSKAQGVAILGPLPIIFDTNIIEYYSQMHKMPNDNEDKFNVIISMNKDLPEGLFDVSIDHEMQIDLLTLL